MNCYRVTYLTIRYARDPEGNVIEQGVRHSATAVCHCLAQTDVEAGNYVQADKLTDIEDEIHVQQVTLVAKDVEVVAPVDAGVPIESTLTDEEMSGVIPPQ